MRTRDEVKPRVRYADVGPVVEGRAASCIPVDHPNFEINNKWILTTPVLKVIRQANGPVFETRNTIYWPAETDESLPKLKTTESAI